MDIPTNYGEVEEMIRAPINDKNRWWIDANIDDSLNHGHVNLESYQLILEEVLKDKPKRVVDIGSNLNQYAYLFTNEGIEYIGIDVNASMNPLTYQGCIFIAGGYEQVKEWFKDDVVISHLCVGYFIEKEEVLCKKLILGDELRRAKYDKYGNRRKECV